MDRGRGFLELMESGGGGGGVDLEVMDNVDGEGCLGMDSKEGMYYL